MIEPSWRYSPERTRLHPLVSAAPGFLREFDEFMNESRKAEAPPKGKNASTPKFPVVDMDSIAQEYRVPHGQILSTVDFLAVVERDKGENRTLLTELKLCVRNQ